LAAAPVVLARGAVLRLSDNEVVRSLVLGVSGIAVWCVIGVALGILLRNQIAAILVAVIYVFVGDLLIAGLLSLADLDGAVPYTPNNANTAAVEGFSPSSCWSGGPGSSSCWPTASSSRCWDGWSAVAATSLDPPLRRRRPVSRRCRRGG